MATAEHGATLSKLLPELEPLWSEYEQLAGPDAYGSQRVAVALEEFLVAFAYLSDGTLLLFDALNYADDLTRSLVRSLVERLKTQPERLSLDVVVSAEDPQVGSF